MSSDDDDRWMDWDSGPVARPYTLTGGRTRPRGERYFDLIDLVARSGKAADTSSFGPERIRILDLCRDPVTVADLASAVGLPLGVVRVLLDDLVHEGLIEVKREAARGPMTDMHLLRQVLDGLQAL
jgi:predicted ArsR family transcriptional regulator